MAEHNLSREWHPTLNGDLKFDDLKPGSTKPVHWLGECGHEWETKFFARATKGARCPYCTNRAVLAGFNDLATVHPELATEWHPTLNGDLTPETVVAGGRSSYHWLGECGHDWATSIRKRAEAGTGCPVCNGVKVLAGFNDLASQAPRIAAEWHPTLNGNLSPQEVMYTSGKKFSWQCTNGHEWEQAVAYRVERDHYCKECPTEKEGNLTETHPNLAAEWHPTKNGELTPKMVTHGSKVRVWWLGECGHEWDTLIYPRSVGNGCPVCSSLRIIAGVNDFASLQPALAQQWHPTLNGDLTPEMIAEHRNEKVWWLGECGHEWDASPSHRVQGRGCPVCVGRRVIVNVNDLFTTHPHLAEEWHTELNERDGHDPHTIPEGGGRHQVWWECKNGHIWHARVADRAVRDYGCPSCSTFVSGAEQDLYDYITSILPSAEEVRQSDRSLLRNQELDVYVPSRNIAIEFNGLWWHNENVKTDRQYHQKKWERCAKADVQLIQIWEDEWRDNAEMVKRMLAHKFGVTTSRTVGARKTTVSIVDKEDAKVFLEENHIQGYAVASHYVGLRMSDTNELVALLLVKWQGQHAGLDLVRYATSANVIGGFTKLLKWVEDEHKPKRIVTFSDHCVSDGQLYESNGFVADKVLPADYKYVVNNTRKHKFGYRLDRFESDPNLLFEEGMSESQLAQLNGFPRIWDAGKTRWVKVLGDANETGSNL